MPVKYIYNH